VLQEGSARVVIRTESGSDGTIHQTVTEIMGPPAEEEETEDGRTFLRLKDGTKVLACEAIKEQIQQV
jgi:hypothetical protein